MQSSIYNFFAKVFHVLAVWFDASVFGKCYNAFCTFLGKCFTGSLIGHLFNKSVDSNNWWQASLLYRVLSLPSKICRFIAIKGKKIIEKIYSGSHVLRLVDNWELVSIRVYGVVLFFFTVAHGFISIILQRADKFMYILYAVLLIASLLMTMLNRSPKSLFKGSFFLRMFGGLFCEVRKESSRLFLQDKDIVVSGTLFGAFIGISCAVLAAFLPAKIFLLLVCGVFGSLLIMRYLELGVFVTVICSPILPTMVLVGLCLICVLSLVFKMLTDSSFRPRTSGLDVFVIF